MASIPTFAQHDFRKASASNPYGECVQVARRDGWVEIRDDKTAFGAPNDHRLIFTAERFDRFLAATRAGELGLRSPRSPRHTVSA